MGSSSSKEKDKINNLEKENDILQNKIEKLTEKVHELLYINELHKIRETAEFHVQNGMCNYKTNNALEEINKVKNDKSYEYVALSGGGIKGVAYIGAFRALDECNILYDENGKLKLKGIAGTSAGSIMASLVAVGYKPDELIGVLGDIELTKIFDDKWGIIRDAINFIDDYGVAPGTYIYETMGRLIEKKTGNKDYTIQQLYDNDNIKLVLVGTDMNNLKSVYFYPNSIGENKNISIRNAVRISMSIPFMFEPVMHGGNYCVDGGVLDNFPLHVFDGEYPGEMKARLNLLPPNPKVLGLHIMEDNQLESYALNKRQDIPNLLKYSASFINIFLTENERRIMTPSYWYRTISIITPNYPLTDFTLTDNQIKKLMDAGHDYTNGFFSEDKNMNDIIVERTKELIDKKNKK